MSATRRTSLTQRLLEPLRRVVLDGQIPERPRVRAWLLHGFRTLALSGLRFERDRGREWAAGLAYSTLLALIPLVLLGISAVEWLAPESGENAATEFVLDTVFPARAESVKSGFTELFAESRAALGTGGANTTVRVFSLILLLYFATSLIRSVDGIVARVFRTASARGTVWRRLPAYWATLTLGPLVLALSFAGTIAARDLIGDGAGAVLSNITRFGTTWCAVFLFYLLVPRTRVRPVAALAGAVVAGSLWEASKIAMGAYLAQPKTLLTAMTIFPAALLWMYVTWVIALYGLEVVYVVHHRVSSPGRRADLAPPRGLRLETLTLGAAMVIARAFERGDEPARDAIAARLRTSEDAARVAVTALEEAGIVAGGDEGGYRLTRGTSGLRVDEILAACRGTPEPPESGSDSPSIVRAYAFLARREETAESFTDETTLADLLRDDPGTD